MEQLLFHENKDCSRDENRSSGKARFILGSECHAYVDSFHRSLVDDACQEKSRTSLHARISFGSSSGHQDRNMMLVKTGKRSSFSVDANG
eukprot:755944-Hanusia_phi.AAC.2